VNRANGLDATLIEADLAAATGELRAFGAPFYLAKVLLERGSRESVEEALGIFTELGATPWVEQAKSLAMAES
jgi:hypothetical protein